MSSGSYFPSPVLAVEIPKKTGGTNILKKKIFGVRREMMIPKNTNGLTCYYNKKRKS